MENEKPKRQNKPGAGRPFKMKIWVDKLKEVLEENEIAFITNEDLVFLVNEKIDDPSHEITIRTYKNWIAGKFHPDEEVGKKFIKLVKNALIKQKQNLVKKMFEGDDKYWYKYGWLLERKFQEFNLKAISEVKHTNEQKAVIQITAANTDQATLINSIINGDNVIDIDFSEVEPIKLPAKNDNKKEDEYDF